MEVEEKIAEMQKYIPCLKLLIGNLEKNPNKEEQVKKMQYLLEMLTKKDSSIKLETLTRCEGILMKVYGKEKLLANTSECNGDKDHNLKVVDTNICVEQEETPRPIDENLINGNSSESQLKIVSVVGSVSVMKENDPEDRNQTTNGQEVVTIDVDGDDPKSEADEKIVTDKKDEDDKMDDDKKDENVNKDQNDKKAADDQPDEGDKKDEDDRMAGGDKINILHDQDCVVLEESHAESSDDLISPGIEHPQLSVDENEVTIHVAISNGKPQVVRIEKGNVFDTDSEMTNNTDETDLEKQKSISIEMEDVQGECDMEIDVELTNSEAAKLLNAERSLAAFQNNEKNTKPSEDHVSNHSVTSDTNTSGAAATSTVLATLLASKSSVVDLTSDDSNDATPTTSQATQITPPPTPTIPSAVKSEQNAGRFQILSSKPPEKASILYLMTGDNPSTPTTTKSPTTVQSSPTKDPLGDLPVPKIVTIDLLDSDSEDEESAASNRVVSSEKVRSLPDPNGQVTMPAPKFDKPMFTIASVQSISTLQAHQEKRQDVERQLNAIVKAIQCTAHHTVPQKHNGAVRLYLEKFVKDLMFEKTRVNLCLQKLQKTLDLEKYKQVKKIIQTYCSEPVNDPTLPAPSPYCHRIKVYPEKLQFVMSQLFFYHSAISVVGYKVYSLVPHNHKVNGVTASPISDSATKSVVVSQAPPGPPKLLNKGVSQLAKLPLKLATPIKTPFNTGSPAMPVRTFYPPTIASKSVCVTMHATPASRPSPAVSSPLSSSRPSPSPLPTPSNEDLLAPMKSQSTPAGGKHLGKPRRRRRRSDDDDENDENYVPQGYLSESDEEASESPTDAATRRTSLQRASKLRCQKYLELERAIDDETYIRATEATITNALKGGSMLGSLLSSSSQPPAKKAKATPRAKKKHTSQAEEDADGTTPEDEELEDDEEDVRPLKRKRMTASNNDQNVDDNEDDDEDLALEINFSGESVVKNVHRAVHCRSRYVDRCLVCSEKLIKKCMVSHYVNSHRGREVFCSRITKSDLMKLQSETMCFAFLSASKSAVNTYVAYCIFCQQEQTLSLKNWWDHYTRHTGEYGYGCSSCSVRRSCRAQINRHIKVECTQKGSKLVELHELDPSVNCIVAYVCLLCNYIQLNENGVLMHLQTEHEFPGSVHELPDGLYQMVNLLKIEQNFYEGGVFGVTPISGSVQVPSTDDMSFMICNMLASGQEQADQVAAVAATGVDESNSDMISEYSNENRSQSPEMIIPESIPAFVVTAVPGDGGSKIEVKKEYIDDVQFSSADQKSSEKRALTHFVEVFAESIKEDLSRNSEESASVDATVKMEATTSEPESGLDKNQATEMNCATKASTDENKAIINSGNSTDRISSDKPAKLSTDGDKSAANKDTVITDSNASSLESKVSKSNANDGSSARQRTLTAVEEDLTRSATETIFQRVTTSLIDSAFESMEVATTVSSESTTSDLPETTTTISSESTSDMPESVDDSAESAPEFLKATVDSDGKAATETVSSDLGIEKGHVEDVVDLEKGIEQVQDVADSRQDDDVVALEANGQAEEILPGVADMESNEIGSKTASTPAIVVEQLGGEVFEIFELSADDIDPTSDVAASSNLDKENEASTSAGPSSVQEPAELGDSESGDILAEPMNDVDSATEDKSVKESVEEVINHELVEENAEKIEVDAVVAEDIVADEIVTEKVVADEVVTEDIPKDTMEADVIMADETKDADISMDAVEETDTLPDDANLDEEAKAAEKNATEQIDSDAMETDAIEEVGVHIGAEADPTSTG